MMPRALLTEAPLPNKETLCHIPFEIAFPIPGQWHCCKEHHLTFVRDFRLSIQSDKSALISAEAKFNFWEYAVIIGTNRYHQSL